MEGFICENEEFKVDAGLDWKPVKVDECRGDVLLPGKIPNDTDGAQMYLNGQFEDSATTLYKNISNFALLHII